MPTCNVPVWAHTRNTDVFAFPDRVEYHIPLYSERESVGEFLTLTRKDDTIILTLAYRPAEKT